MHQIFFIHPDRKLLELYREPLLQHFSFDSAHDGLSAIRKLRLQRPSIIISASSLPKLSGLGVLKFVRSTPSLSHVPFLFLAEEPSQPEALSLGANEWIKRGELTPDELLDRIYYHLRINQLVLK